MGAVLPVRRKPTAGPAESQDRFETQLRDKHPARGRREGNPCPRGARPEARQGPRHPLRPSDRASHRDPGRFDPAPQPHEAAPGTLDQSLREAYALVLLRSQGGGGVQQWASTRTDGRAHRGRSPHRSVARGPLLIPQRVSDLASEGWRIRCPQGRRIHRRGPAPLRGRHDWLRSPRDLRFNGTPAKRVKLFRGRRDAPRGRTTKIFAIGGTGRIGRASSKILAENEIVSQVAIAARDVRLAKKAAADIGAKGIAVEVDATNEARLASLARDYDLIVNTAGPDFRVALPVTRAAISAGVHVCDIAADGPSLEKVLALDGRAKEAGVTVVTGIGHLPGMSNLIMQHAADQLDTVTDLRLCVWWQLSREETDLFGAADAMRKTGRVNASWQTVLTWVAGRVRTYRDGRLVEVDPFEEATE